MHICKENKFRQLQEMQVAGAMGSTHLGEGEVADQLQEQPGRGAIFDPCHVDPTFAFFQVVRWVLGDPHAMCYHKHQARPHHTCAIPMLQNIQIYSTMCIVW